MTNTTNIHDIKEKNLSVLFSYIYHNSPISRAKLAKKIKLSPPTVSALVDEMLEIDIIREVGTANTSTSGRRPMMLDINPEGGYIVIVELVKKGFILTLNNLLCQPVRSERVNLPDFNNLGNEAVNAIISVVESENIPTSRLLGIIISAPGVIDHAANRIITSLSLDINRENCFYDIIQSYFRKVPVILHKKASFCAYAEKWSGPMLEIKNMVYIIVGESGGVGAGLLLNGEVYNGGGNAGEIGHMSIDVNGYPCFCGNRGCLEKYVDVNTIYQRFIHAMLSGRKTSLSKHIGGDLNKINIDAISKCLEEGDPVALEIIDDVAQKFASGLNNIINTLNPELIVIGGIYPKLGSKMLESIREHVSSIWFSSGLENTEIRYRRREYDDIAFGGAMYFIDKIFNVNEYKNRK